MCDILNCTYLTIAGIEYESIVDGPGIRNVVFTQGCKHYCKGCHNPQTHAFNGGYQIKLNELYDKITHNPLVKGITFSGGDPLYQKNLLIPILKKLKQNNYDIWVYTGFTFEELLKYKEINSVFLQYTDVLVDGRFDESCKSFNLTFRGSSNQRIIDVQQTLHTNKIVLCEKYMQ